MTKVGKSGDPDTVHSYFVEEKVVAFPVSLVALGLLSAIAFGSQSEELRFGFVDVWSSNQLGWIGILAVLLMVISVFSILILLDTRENTFCVPIERSASILSGIAAAFVLAHMGIGARPTAAETGGAALLIAAIFVLSLGRGFDKSAAS